MTVFAVLVELLIDGQWVDVTCTDEESRVLGRDKIQITRGRSDWNSRVGPARATLSILNKDGRFSPRNPNSPHYGLLGRNTPIRISMDGRRRFIGEVAEWPLRAEPDEHIPIVAAGVLRRIGRDRSQKPLRSALYRELMGPGLSTLRPYAYWPCEDESDAEAPASAIPGQPPMKVSGAPSFGSYGDLPGSAPVLSIPDDCEIYGDVPSAGLPGALVTVMAVVRLPDAGVAANDTPVLVANTAGTILYWRVRVNINGTLNLQWTDGQSVGSGGITANSSNTSWNIAGQQTIVTLTLQRSGSDVSWSIKAYPVGTGATNSLSGTVTGRTFSRVWRVTVGSNRNLGGTAVGHVAVLPGSVSVDIQDAVTGWKGETAGRRIERLCLEEQVPFSPRGGLDSTAAMGPQRPKELLELLHEAAEADGGHLFEPVSVTRALGEFELGTTDGWVGGSFTTVSVVASPVHSGVGSLRIAWTTQAEPVQRSTPPEIFIPGVTYTISAWVYVPAGDVPVFIEFGDTHFSAVSSINDGWQELTVTAAAVAPAHQIKIRPNGTPATGDICYVDDIIVTTEAPGLAYRTLASTLNRAATLTLDFDLKQVAFPFEPTDDDQQLINDAGVTREGASEQRHVVETGPLSVQPPPAGVGRYPQDLTRNVETDQQAFQLAAWTTHNGTWDEARVPSLSVNLRRQPTLAAAAAACEMGYRIVAINPPSWMPPADVDQLVQGYDETLDSTEWMIDFNTTPAGVNWVMELDEDTGRLDSETSFLESDITSTATTITVRLRPELWDEVKAEAVGQGTSAAANYIIVLDADAVPFNVSDAVRLYDSAGQLKEDKVFTIVAKNSAFGFTNIEYEPSSFAGTYAGDVIQSFYQWPASPWTTDPVDFPFQVKLFDPRTSIGEVVTVSAITAITGVNGTQDFTVTRGVNGVHRAWPGESTQVRLAVPYGLSYVHEV